MRAEKNGGLHTGDRRAARLLRAARVIGCAAACGVAAGVAHGAAFQVNTIDAGGVQGGSLGNPITWTGGAAFNPGAGSNFPPSPNAIFASPAVGFDSYVAIDPNGPSTASSTSSSTDGYQSLGPSNIIGPTSPTTIFQTDRLTGIWFNAGANGGFVTSGVGPTGMDRMFIAQISLRPTSSDPTTQGVLVNIRDAGTQNSDGELGALRFGAANATNNNGKWGQSYYLDFVRRFNPSIFPVTPPPPAAYEIYIVAVPGAGTATTLALVGVAALRRRRSG